MGGDSIDIIEELLEFGEPYSDKGIPNPENIQRFKAAVEKGHELVRSGKIKKFLQDDPDKPLKWLNIVATIEEGTYNKKDIKQLIDFLSQFDEMGIYESNGNIDLSLVVSDTYK